MKKNIWVFLLIIVVFNQSEGLLASDDKPDVMTSDKVGSPRGASPLHKKTTTDDEPIDYFSVNRWTDSIVGSLRQGAQASKDSIMNLLGNVQEDEFSIDKVKFTQYIDTLSCLMKITSTQRGKKESFQANIESFAATLKELADTVPMGKIKKVMLLVQQKY
jgi:hypothetical protein